MTPKEYIDEGLRLMDEGQEAQAKEAFQKAYEQDDMVGAVMLGSLAYDAEDYKTASKYLKEASEIYVKIKEPDEYEKFYGGVANFYMGEIFYRGLAGKQIPQMAAAYYVMAFVNCEYEPAREMAGLMYYQGYFPSGEGKTGREKGMELWEEGMNKGDGACTLHWCVDKVENDEVTPEVLQKLEDLTKGDDEHCYPDAAAVLYSYYYNEGDEEQSEKWRQIALDLDSDLIQSLIADEAEEEIGEDDWHPHTDMSMFFAPDEDEDEDDDEYEGHDDETEAAHPGYPEVGEKYVIIAAVDDSFRIVQADAADWRSLPALIGAERCDDMRCQKFRDIAHKLMLPGMLLGQLDKDAFRKPHLKPNWHASQWYDGNADLMGAMVICLEDAQYNPFSFTSKAQAQSVIDALCK